MVGDVRVGRSGYALFACMQAISPAFIMLIRSFMRASCEYRHVRFERQCPCTYSYWYTSMWLAVQIPEHKQHPRQQKCKHLKYLEYLQYSKYCTPLHYTSLRSTILVLAYQWVCGRQTLPVSCNTRIRSMYLVRMIRVRTVPYTTCGTAVLVLKCARFLWYLIVCVMSFTRDFWSGHGPRARTRMNAYVRVSCHIASRPSLRSRVHYLQL